MLFNARHLTDNARRTHYGHAALQAIGSALVDGDGLIPSIKALSHHRGSDAADARFALDVKKTLKALDLDAVLVRLGKQQAKLAVLLAKLGKGRVVGGGVGNRVARRFDSGTHVGPDVAHRRCNHAEGALDGMQRAAVALAAVNSGENKRRRKQCTEHDAPHGRRFILLKIQSHRRKRAT